MCLSARGDNQDADGTSRSSGVTLCALKGSGVPTLPPWCSWGTRKDQLTAGCKAVLLFPEANRFCKPQQGSKVTRTNLYLHNKERISFISCSPVCLELFEEL